MLQELLFTSNYSPDIICVDSAVSNGNQILWVILKMLEILPELANYLSYLEK